jgi:hypothetical protein
VRLPLEYLREVGAIPPGAEVLDDGPVAQVLAGYREYLVLERGLAAPTIDRCQRAASLFLKQSSCSGVTLSLDHHPTLSRSLRPTARRSTGATAPPTGTTRPRSFVRERLYARD